MATDTYTCQYCGDLYHGILACPVLINWGEYYGY